MEVKIDLSNNRTIESSSLIIGKTNENRATTLVFELAECMLDKWFYLEFKLPDNSKMSTERLEIDVENKKVFYDITNNLLAAAGELQMEVVLRTDDNKVWKSYLLKFQILNSINATDYIEEENQDFVSECQHVMDIIDETGDGNNFLSDDGTYKAAVIDNDYVHTDNNYTDGEKQKVNLITNDGDGETFLSNDGTYKNVVLDDNYSHTDNNYTNEDKAKVAVIITDGNDNKFLSNDGTYKDIDFPEEVDPTVPGHVKSITQEDIEVWNNKSNFSGSYTDLTNKPSIPSKTSELTNDSNFATQSYVDTKVSSVYKYKGNVNTYEDLPSSNQEIGDVYNVIENGMNYAWNGETWDALGSEVDLSDYVTNELLGTTLNDYVLSSSLANVATSGNYDDLSNRPIIYLSDLNGSKNIVIRNLSDGVYILYGYFKPNASGSFLAASYPIIATVNTKRSISTTYMQLFFPVDNMIQYFVITDSGYTKENIELSNLESKTEIDTNSATTITLLDNTKYVRNTVTSLTLSYPVTISDDYISSLVFTAGTGITVSIANTNFVGDHCSNYVFTPLEGYIYEITFSKVGSIMSALVNEVGVI